MADSNSRAFTPAVNTIRENDPMIMKVPTDKVDFAFRKSQTPPMKSEGMTLSHVKSGS
jgi:hypothetical protein